MLGILKKKKYPLKKDKVYVGAGIDLLKNEVGRIYWDKPHYQTIAFGGSGSGKSELISRWTYEAIIDDKQFFGIDPKGSKSWLESFFLACHKKGFLYDKEKGPVVLTLPYPELSVKINPLYGMDPHQIASTIANGIPEGKEPFFKQIAYEIVLTASLGLYARGEKEIILSDIYQYLKVETLKELEEKIKLEAIKNPERKDLIEQALITLNNIASYDPQYFPRVNSSLRTYLTRLITGNAGKILNVRAGNILWDRLEKGNLKFFAFLNAEAMQQVAYDVGRLLFANLLIYVGMQSKKLKKIEPQLRVIVDEATEVGFSELNKAIRLVRERNVSVAIFTQSPSGFASAFGKDGKGMVIDIVNSCDLRIGFRLASTEDREFMANMSPEVSKGQLMLHQNSMNLYYKEAKLLKPFDFENLDPGFGYAFLDKTVYYFYTPLISKYDKTKVKVVFDDNPEQNGKDIIINLKDLSSNYQVIDTQKPEQKGQEGRKVKGKGENKDKDEEILYIVMKDISKNYQKYIDEEFKDKEIRDFYNQLSSFFKVYNEDFKKLLGIFDLFKNTVSSVPGNEKALLSRVSLLQHSLGVALEAYNKVKDTPDLIQEEKELVVLASLAHDIGKAFITIKSYETEDHVRMTREILGKINVNPIIIKLASAHHEKPLGKYAKLLNYVKQADQKTRQDEEEKVKGTVSNEIKNKIDLRKIKNNLINMANKKASIVYLKDKQLLCVKKEELYNLIKKEISENDEIINDDFMQKLFPGSKFMKLIGYNKMHAIKLNYVCLAVPSEGLKIQGEKCKELKEIKEFELEEL